MGLKIEIPTAKIRKLHQYIEAIPVMDGISMFVGGTREYIALETEVGNFKIPRSPENEGEDICSKELFAATEDIEKKYESRVVVSLFDRKAF